MNPPIKSIIQSFTPPPGVGLYSLANLIATITSGIVLTSTVMYFSLAAQIDATTIGITMTIGSSLGVIVMPFVGKAAARYSPKRIYLILLAGQSTMLFLWQMASITGVAILVLGLSIMFDRSINAVTGGYIACLPIANTSWPRTRAYLRSMTNVGVGVGGLVAGIFLTLDSPSSLRILLTVAAIGPALAALLVWRVAVIFQSKKTEETRSKDTNRTDHLTSNKNPSYIALALSNGVLSISTDILAVAVPLIVLGSQSLPNGFVGAATVINTVLVVILQVHVSDRTNKSNWHGRAYWAAGCLLTGLWLLYSASIIAGYSAVAIMMVAVLLITFSELIQSSVSFLLSYETAPEGMHAEYQATYATGRATIRAIAPAALSGCVRSGPAGWLIATMVVASATIAQRRAADSLLQRESDI